MLQPTKNLHRSKLIDKNFYCYEIFKIVLNKIFTRKTSAFLHAQIGHLKKLQAQEKQDKLPHTRQSAIYEQKK